MPTLFPLLMQFRSAVRNAPVYPSTSPSLPQPAPRAVAYHLIDVPEGSTAFVEPSPSGLRVYRDGQFLGFFDRVKLNFHPGRPLVVQTAPVMGPAPTAPEHSADAQGAWNVNSPADVAECPSEIYFVNGGCQTFAHGCMLVRRYSKLGWMEYHGAYPPVANNGPTKGSGVSVG